MGHKSKDCMRDNDLVDSANEEEVKEPRESAQVDLPQERSSAGCQPRNSGDLHHQESEFSQIQGVFGPGNSDGES